MGQAEKVKSLCYVALDLVQGQQLAKLREINAFLSLARVQLCHRGNKEASKRAAMRS